MKTFHAVLIIIAIASTSVAGTVTKGSVKHKVSTKDTCTTGVGCATAVKVSLNTTLEASLTPAEVAGLNGDTLIESSIPLGPKIFFRLSDDPNFAPGDTSVKISRTTVFNSMPWKENISLKWTNGTLKMKAKGSANAKLNNFAAVPWEGGIQSKVQRETLTSLLITILGSNQGANFINLEAAAGTSIKTTNSTKPKTTGDTTVQSTQQVKGSVGP